MRVETQARDESFLFDVLTGKRAAYQHKKADEGEGGVPSGSGRAGGPDLLSARVVAQTAGPEPATSEPSNTLKLLLA